MSVTERSHEILDQVVDRYLSSGDFNGLPVPIEADAETVTAVCRLIEERHVDLVRGDGHPNPHIKAFPAEAPETQLAKIEAGGLAGCLYPTSKLLHARNAGDGVAAPYTRELHEGAPQLDHRVFDLRVLEWYRNDPRFEFDVDDIHGRIIQRAGTEIAGRRVLKDGLEFFEFGFAYDEERNRAIAAFIRYLHDLPLEQQIDLKKYELTGRFQLHPDYFRTQIIGDFPERMSIYGAFLEEKAHINAMCELIGKPPLFSSEHKEYSRPHGFGILIRPTKKEYRDFVLLLDQLLSDDLNRYFFKGDVEMHRILINEQGKEEKHSKGTIILLEEWVTRRFRPADPEPLKEMFRDIRAVRKERQNPAHNAEDNEFDQQYVAKQRELIIKAFDAVRTLRMMLENHPRVQGYEVPDYLREARVWTM